MKRECPYCQTEQDVDQSLDRQDCECCGETFEYEMTEEEAREIYADSLYDLARDA